MDRTRRYDIEGAILYIPLRYDERAGMDIEEYPTLRNSRSIPRRGSG